MGKTEYLGLQLSFLCCKCSKFLAVYKIIFFTTWHKHKFLTCYPVQGTPFTGGSAVGQTSFLPAVPSVLSSGNHFSLHQLDLKKSLLKGIVSRDFLLQVFMHEFPLSPCLLQFRRAMFLHFMSLLLSMTPATLISWNISNYDKKFQFNSSVWELLEKP